MKIKLKLLLFSAFCAFNFVASPSLFNNSKTLAITYPSKSENEYIELVNIIAGNIAENFAKDSDASKTRAASQKLLKFVDTPNVWAHEDDEQYCNDVLNIYDVLVDQFKTIDLPTNSAEAIQNFLLQSFSDQENEEVQKNVRALAQNLYGFVGDGVRESVKCPLDGITNRKNGNNVYSYNSSMDESSNLTDNSNSSVVEESNSEILEVENESADVVETENEPVNVVERETILNPVPAVNKTKTDEFQVSDDRNFNSSFLKYRVIADEDDDVDDEKDDVKQNNVKRIRKYDESYMSEFLDDFKKNIRKNAGYSETIKLLFSTINNFLSSFINKCGEYYGSESFVDEKVFDTLVGDIATIKAKNLSVDGETVIENCHTYFKAIEKSLAIYLKDLNVRKTKRLKKAEKSSKKTKKDSRADKLLQKQIDLAKNLKDLVKKRILPFFDVENTKSSLISFLNYLINKGKTYYSSNFAYKNLNKIKETLYGFVKSIGNFNKKKTSNNENKKDKKNKINVKKSAKTVKVN